MDDEPWEGFLNPEGKREATVNGGIGEGGNDRLKVT